MSEQTQKIDLGYVFYPYETRGRPGHPRLDIIIAQAPTFRHFDPEKVHLQVASRKQDNIEQISLHHPWPLERHFRVCAGRIVLSDRNLKQVEAFSFGGELQVISDDERTFCSVSSSAPIYHLFSPDDLSMWLTAEVEILLARQRAHWDPNHPHDFEAHLATTDPFLLYASCLQTLSDEDCHTYAHAQKAYDQAVDFVQAEIRRLRQEEQWPVLLPTMDELFQPDPLK